MIETIVEITDLNGTKIKYESFMTKNGFNTFKDTVDYYSGLSFVKKWSIKDKKTKKIITSSVIVNKEIAEKKKAAKQRKTAQVSSIKEEPKKKRKRKPFSAEHKRKIAEALKRRHAAKKK